MRKPFLLSRAACAQPFGFTRLSAIRGCEFLLALSILTAPTFAMAGDPCPIDFTFYDAGVPPWLDRNEVLGQLESKKMWLGIRYKDAAGGGVVVEYVHQNSSAHDILEKGDLLLQIDGAKITDRDDANNAFDAMQPTQNIQIMVEREHEILMLDVQVGVGDPLARSLAKVAEGQECADVRVGELDDAQLDAVLAGAFEENHRFRCEDAHTQIKGFEPGNVVIVRGSNRVLLATIGWHTECVKAASYDGDKLNDKKLGELLETITKDYVADRHANP